MTTLEEKNSLLRQQVAILKNIAKGKEPSEVSVNLGTEDPLFEDSVKHVCLYADLTAYIRILESVINYNVMVIKSEKN